MDYCLPEYNTKSVPMGISDLEVLFVAIFVFEKHHIYYMYGKTHYR